MSLKDRFFIEEISRDTAKKVLDKFHYLHKQGFNFRSGINYGLFNKESKNIVGVAVFHTTSAKYIIKGCFGIESFKLDGFYELGRLAIDPKHFEPNITSFFLGNAIKLLRRKRKIVALLSYADDEYHKGYIYQALNFKYYGLTDKKKDFWIKNEDGTETKLQRGKCRHLNGEWRNKSQKHRYLLIYDKNLKTLWKEESYPKGEQNAPMNSEIVIKEEKDYVPKEMLQLKIF